MLHPPGQSPYPAGNDLTDIAIGKNRSLNQGLVLILHPVVNFKAFSQASKNGDSIFHVWLIHDDGLKRRSRAASFSTIFAVFVQRSRTDTVEFATGKHGLEHIARINRALYFTCPNNGMHLINEQNDPPIRFAHLIEHRFQPLLKFREILPRQAVNPFPKNGLVPNPSGTSPRTILWANPPQLLFSHSRFSYEYWISGLGAERSDNL